MSYGDRAMAVLFDRTFTMRTLRKATFGERYIAWGEALAAMNRAQADPRRAHWARAAAAWDAMADLHAGSRDESIYRLMADECRQRADKTRRGGLSDTAPRTR